MPQATRHYVYFPKLTLHVTILPHMCYTCMGVHREGVLVAVSEKAADVDARHRKGAKILQKAPTTNPNEHQSAQQTKQRAPSKEHPERQVAKH